MFMVVMLAHYTCVMSVFPLLKISLLISHRDGLGPIPGEFISDFWWTKYH
jgi:hypothetical protein